MTGAWQLADPLALLQGNLGAGPGARLALVPMLSSPQAVRVRGYDYARALAKVCAGASGCPSGRCSARSDRPATRSA